MRGASLRKIAVARIILRQRYVQALRQTTHALHQAQRIQIVQRQREKMLAIEAWIQRSDFFRDTADTRRIENFFEFRRGILGGDFFG